MPRQTTGFALAPWAILVGGITGTILCALEAALSGQGGAPHDMASWLLVPGGLLILGLVFAVWIAGIAMFGVPFWWVLERYGLTRWYVALITGFVLPFVVIVSAATFNDFLGRASHNHFSSADSGGPDMIDGWRTAHGWHNLMTQAAVFAGDGAVVAYVIWLLSYYRGNDTPAGPSKPDSDPPY